MSMPTDRVLRAFARSGTPKPIAGGRKTAWRIGNLVLKPADVSVAELQWQAQVLATVRPGRVRLVLPLRSTEGEFVVEGWIATPYVEAAHEPGRWLDIIAIGRRLSTALVDLPRPAFLDTRQSPWDLADRQAWDEEPIDGRARYLHLDALARLRRPLAAPAQVIHGDLTGNVLFAEGLAPAVIDFSAYWRPAAYASAIVVADALAWEGALDDVLEGLDGEAEAGQFLVRALLFRAIAEILREPGVDPQAAAKPFARAVDLARSLVGRT